MRHALGACAFVAFVAPALAAEPVKESFYAISGKTGMELYRSIGERGPAGGGHVAQTNFKLTWKRLFDERGGDCFLVYAKPVLTITQTYPKPSNKLSSDMQRRWDKFLSGIRKHEQTHVRMIGEMVSATEASLVGMSVQGDPTCAKVKAAVKQRINEGYEAHRDRTRQYDRTDLGMGGKAFLVLEDLVNER